MRLMRACERLRKLLSQLPSSSVTVENISDAGDVNVNMTREDMARVCSEPLNKLSQLLNSVIEGFKDDIVAVEVVGGGVRMAMVQELILSVLGKDLPLGAKLDDGSIAVGAAILTNEKNEKALQDLIKAVSVNENIETTQTTTDEQQQQQQVDESTTLATSDSTLPSSSPLQQQQEQLPTVGLTLENIIAARQAEIFMQVTIDFYHLFFNSMDFLIDFINYHIIWI